MSAAAKKKQKTSSTQAFGVHWTVDTTIDEFGDGCGGEMCPRSEKCAKGRGHSGWCNVKRAEPSPIAYDADEDDMPLQSDGSATE